MFLECIFKIEERRESDRKETEKKKAEFKAGNRVGLSGRDMFTFNPDLACDDDDGDEGKQTHAVIFAFINFTYFEPPNELSLLNCCIGE